MKKLISTFALLLCCLCFGNAQDSTEDEDIIVSSNVSKHAYILSLQDLSFGALDTAGTNTATGVIVIRSNYARWKFKVYAEKGALAEWDVLTSSFVTGGETIPYTFTFNSVSAVPSERIIAQTVPLAQGVELVASFSEKTKWGANGQPFTYSVDVNGTGGGSAWSAGDYRDLLHVSIVVD